MVRVLEQFAHVLKNRRDLRLLRWRNVPREGFVNLVNEVGLEAAEHALFAAPPRDLDREIRRTAGRKYAHGIVTGHVASPTDHFLGLSHGPAGYFDFGANTLSVRRFSLQTNAQARRGGLVLVEQWRRVEAINDNVQIAVVIKVCQRHAIGDLFGVKAPVRADLPERQIVLVPEGQVRGLQARILQDFSAGLADGKRADAFEAVPSVEIVHVIRKAVRDQDIFPAVQIHVQENAGPTPLRTCQAAEMSDLSIGAVNARMEQGITADLRLIGDLADPPRLRVHIPHLSHHPPMIPAEHVDHEKIVVPVPVDVGGINAHRKIAGLPLGEKVQRAKPALAVIEPETIRG